MPFIIRFSQGVSVNKIMAAIAVSMAINQNTGTSYPRTPSSFIEIDFICEATKLPAANDPIQTPIIVETNLPGDNLVTIDNPIGERQSSPNVCIINTIISQSGLTFVIVSPALETPLAIAIITKPKLSNNIPHTNFMGVFGFKFRLESLTHNTENIGAKITIKIALTL